MSVFYGRQTAAREPRLATLLTEFADHGFTIIATPAFEVKNSQSPQS